MLLATGLCHCGPGNERAAEKPVVVVTHPTAAFVESATGLRTRGQLPEVRWIFLLHERETRLRRSVERAQKRHRWEDVEFVTLRKLPKDTVAPVHADERSRLGFRSRRLEPRIPYRVPEGWLAAFRDVAARSDGAFIPGGSNIPAALYGEKQLAEAASRTPLRSLYELAFLRFLLEGEGAFLRERRHYLVLGLCYGMQALNVALGGSLVQSIPHEVYGVRHAEDLVSGDPDRMHRNYHLAVRPPSAAKVYRGWFHRLRVDRGTPFFYRAEGVYILSNHVQAVKRPAADLRIVGWSTDGRVPELAVHRRFRNVLAVQGHPEREFAWKRLDRQPQATQEFHRKLWAETSRVLLRNARRRAAAARK